MIFPNDADIPLEKTNRHAWKYVLFSLILFCASLYPFVIIEIRYHHVNCYPKDHNQITVHIDHGEYTCESNRNVTKTTNCWVDINGDECMAVEYDNPYTHTYLSALIMGGFIGLVAIMVGFLAIREIRKNKAIMDTGVEYEKV